jgi:hypothetical protein
MKSKPRLRKRPIGCALKVPGALNPDTRKHWQSLWKEFVEGTALEGSRALVMPLDSEVMAFGPLPRTTR